ncbi:MULTISPECIES: RDD family protein [unclassified Arcicella]|uniref:RDD family protein n=1 Tax=unclassified Arcicella TaxID=2644986 RepID=UPI00285525D1|nr:MULTISPECIES: RDD family protein [unclassified Arcicella]MDR6561678.1 putative RDD family membrane protein YckC [Arcicella sp. BE51]MDR6812458.1 putative RDD family membrane protein YckC [Arcicella sp. BE140]MDR6823770.1 putative RDD family membrane protein YckC [Arcicella sp. BE139]
MLTREQLIENYSSFDDGRIKIIARDVYDLTPEIREILRTEINKRGLAINIPNEEEILTQPKKIDKEELAVLLPDNNSFIYAKIPARGLNRIFDFLLTYGLIFFLILFFELEDSTFIMFLSLAIFIGNYFFLEKIYGKTIAKYLTKTKTVTIAGGNLTWNHITTRSICRLIPLDGLSILINHKRAWHDYLSQTVVVEDFDQK